MRILGDRSWSLPIGGQECREAKRGDPGQEEMDCKAVFPNWNAVQNTTPKMYPSGPGKPLFSTSDRLTHNSCPEMMNV